MATKSYLKQARELINKKDYQGASNAAMQALQHDPVNYNAYVSVMIDRAVNLVAKPPNHWLFRNVFLGLASLELGDLKRSEEVSHPTSCFYFLFFFISIELFCASQAYQAAINQNRSQPLAWQVCLFFAPRQGGAIQNTGLSVRRGSHSCTSVRNGGIHWGNPS